MVSALVPRQYDHVGVTLENGIYWNYLLNRPFPSFRNSTTEEFNRNVWLRTSVQFAQRFFFSFLAFSECFICWMRQVPSSETVVRDNSKGTRPQSTPNCRRRMAMHNQFSQLFGNKWIFIECANIWRWAQPSMTVARRRDQHSHFDFIKFNWCQSMCGVRGTAYFEYNF